MNIVCVDRAGICVNNLSNGTLSFICERSTFDNDYKLIKRLQSLTFWLFKIHNIYKLSNNYLIIISDAMVSIPPNKLPIRIFSFSACWLLS